MVGLNSGGSPCGSTSAAPVTFSSSDADIFARLDRVFSQWNTGRGCFFGVHPVSRVCCGCEEATSRVVAGPCPGIAAALCFSCALTYVLKRDNLCLTFDDLALRASSAYIMGDEDELSIAELVEGSLRESDLRLWADSLLG